MKAGRKSLPPEEQKVQTQIYVQKKVITKLGRSKIQEIATDAVNKAFNCTGTCEVCICKNH